MTNLRRGAVAPADARERLAWLREGVCEDKPPGIPAHREQERALEDAKLRAMAKEALDRAAQVRHRGRPCDRAPKQRKFDP